jgi:hypothetical protein
MCFCVLLFYTREDGFVMVVYLLVRERFLCFTTQQIYGAQELLLFGCFFAGMIPLNVLARRRYYSDMIYQSRMNCSFSDSSSEAFSTPSLQTAQEIVENSIHSPQYRTIPPLEGLSSTYPKPS